MIELGLGVWIFSGLVVFGFQLGKADSPFIKADFSFWIFAVIGSLLGPITLALILGNRLAGR